MEQGLFRIMSSSGNSSSSSSTDDLRLTESNKDNGTAEILKLLPYVYLFYNYSKLPYCLVPINSLDITEIMEVTQFILLDRIQMHFVEKRIHSILIKVIIFDNNPTTFISDHEYSRIFNILRKCLL